MQVRIESGKDDLLDPVRKGFYADEKKYIDDILATLDEVTPTGETCSN